MKTPKGLIHKIFPALFIGALLIMLYGYFKGYELSIPWNVTTTAEVQEFPAHQFTKGPFQFTFSGEKYTLAESFSAGPVTQDPTANAFFLVLIFTGLCMMLVISTHFSRFWFIVSMGLFIFFLINLRLQDIGIFGFGVRSSWSVGLILSVYVIPAYLIHAFYPRVKTFIRLLIFLAISGLLVAFSGVSLTALEHQLISGGYYGLIILSLLFLLAIAEEILFAMLYLITQSRGGKNNHIHFIIFSTIYLLFLGIYYGSKTRILKFESAYFDPFILLAVSAVAGLWSLQFKKDLFDRFMGLQNARLLYTGLGLLVFAFLGLSFFRGNDPVYEGFHYFIVYVHLGFGLLFFLYLLVNFITPLAQGLQVYRIAFKEQTFPYITARLGGLVAVAAFFFLSNKEAFLLFRAGHYNYLGAQTEAQDEKALAQEYYREGSIYGHDNHFSNYQLGYNSLQKSDLNEADYHFGRATLRHPSSQSFINHAGILAKKGETTPSLVSLKNGLREFPGNDQLLNNLGLTYADLGDYTQAAGYFEQAKSSADWTNATRVNLWKVKTSEEAASVTEDFNKGNLAVKTNILAGLLNTGLQPEIAFDSSYLYPSYPLHRTAFLINSMWYFRDPEIARHLEQAISGPSDEAMYYAARHALALNHYLTGDINRAMLALDQLQYDADTKASGQYLNEMGQIALEQHALEIALDFFGRALEQQNAPALLNKAAALMESGRFEEAEQWISQLVALDSGYRALAGDMQMIVNARDLDHDRQLTRLYYYYPEYSLAEMSALLAETKKTFIVSLWDKISRELLASEAHAELHDYEQLLRNYLPAEAFHEVNLLQDLADDGALSPGGGHRVYEILELEDSARISELLYEAGSRNGLNAPLTLGIASLLKNYDHQKAYNLLVVALDINRTNVALHKSYALTALEAGLSVYAKSTLEKLESIMPPAEYRAFSSEFERKQEELESSAPW